ncbi:NAD-dependent succinate-semialdehyde dehydrogenase [Acinetobacter rudis]|uniref:NAD-dependent succinate-semialdehyde dehydrogenase n=1 Tax=Acinetobacter rudis TaxID=632955 RepID=A0AAW8J8I6_9GAMM|nr:NAD-dependent succinate-semialdehyde dehydrogenase [Acinetobacter rudis]MDQ8936049.1 NAD-dependent succinate-semialdehyde dehydrogenase [Acinetobacter rudis]MDQ9018312.1 NAD-dependent succinate-semialdehyde dehydrogenase [Acinetobacter rudis]
MDITQFSVFENRCLVNGEWLSAEETLAVTNPLDQTVITTVPVLSEQVIEQAIVDANIAQKKWKEIAPNERSRLLRCWFDLLMQHQDELAAIMTVEQGKPLKEAKGEIAYAASYIEWFSEEAKRAYGDIIPSAANSEIFVFKEAIGVCAAITPWNFPAAMITRKVAPALAAGCSILVKPASETPLTALAIAKLAEQAGFPKGVFNVITGSSTKIGQIFTQSPIVKKLSFTGSTEIGAKLMAQSAPTVKKLSLELGGNAPVLVFNSANLDQAVQGVMDTKFRNAGQTCVCANRIYVQSEIYDVFVDKLKSQVEKMKMGNGLDADTDIGPLINRKAVAKVEEHIADALSKGAVLVTGKTENTEGNWCVPTLVKDVTQQMLCAKEETFGPFAPIFKFETEEQVIEMSNDTEFGLASYVFTQDINQFIRVSRGLEYGMVGVNTGLISNAAAPFGGVKASGIGREGSKYGMDEYLEMKYVCLGNIQ